MLSTLRVRKTLKKSAVGQRRDGSREAEAIIDKKWEVRRRGERGGGRGEERRMKFVLGCIGG